MPSCGTFSPQLPPKAELTPRQATSLKIVSRGIGVKHDFPCFHCLSTGSNAVPAELLIRRRLQGVELKILEREIDHLVYELYGLTDDEIKVVGGNDLTRRRGERGARYNAGFQFP